MTALTQDYLDKSLNDLYEKIDRKFDAQTAELQAFSKQQTEELARIITTTVAEPMQEHFNELVAQVGIRDEVKALKADMLRIKEVLHLN